MAKKDRISDFGQEESRGGKVLTVLIILLIVLIWLAILALLIKFDVGSLGSKVLRPVLKDIPIVNRILPEISEEQEAYENAYPYKTLSEAMEYIKKLELEADKLREENDDYASRQAQMQKEIDSLKHYEEEQEAFAQLKEQFDKEVVYNEKAPSLEDYIKWYESMYPNTATEIYESLVEQQAVEETIQREADLIASMKPKNAAAILSEMSSDVDLICRLLSCMEDKTVTNILTNLDSLFAARIVNRMVELGMEVLE